MTLARGGAPPTGLPPGRFSSPDYQTLEQLADQEIGRLRRHARGETPPARPWHSGHELAAAQAVLAPAVGVATVNWPPDPAVAAVVLEKWVLAVLELARQGDPRLRGTKGEWLARRAMCCPARLLGVPDRDGAGSGWQCKLPGCPCCHALRVALAYDAVEAAVRTRRRQGRPVETAVVPATVRDVVGRPEKPAWLGRVHGGGRYDLVAAPAGTDWAGLPWMQLSPWGDWNNEWMWQPGYQVDPSPEGLARAVARVCRYDRKLMSTSADAAEGRGDSAASRHRTARRGIFRSPTAARSLASIRKPGHARRSVGSSPAEGSYLWHHLDQHLADRRGSAAADSRRDLTEIQLAALRRRLTARGLPAELAWAGWSGDLRDWLCPTRKAVRRWLSVWRASPTAAGVLIGLDDQLFVLAAEADGGFALRHIDDWCRRQRSRVDASGPPPEFKLPPQVVRPSLGRTTPRVRRWRDFQEWGLTRDQRATVSPEWAAEADANYDAVFRRPRPPEVRQEARTATVEDRLVQRLLAWTRAPLSLDDSRRHCRRYFEPPPEGNVPGVYRDGLRTEWFEDTFGQLPVTFYPAVIDPLRREPIRRQLIEAWESVQIFHDAGDDRPRCTVLNIIGRGLVAVHDGSGGGVGGVRTEVVTKNRERLVLEDLDQYLARLVTSGFLGTAVLSEGPYAGGLADTYALADDEPD